ncbi:UNVERIFIED_ORG: hypothetical protein QOE_3579 [Clostridioides difficile F501]
MIDRDSHVRFSSYILSATCFGCGTHHFLRCGRVLYLCKRIWDKGRAMGGGRIVFPRV